MRLLLCCYLVFPIYASFIPFHFNLDPNFVRWRIDIFFSHSLFRGIRHWSSTDVLTNILVYMPLGFVMTGSWYTRRKSNGSRTLPFAIGVVGLLIALAIELGQALSPYRSPSMLDAFCNGLGTFIGATLSYHLLPALEGALGTRVAAGIYEQRILLLIVFVLLAPIVDALYPFQIKLAMVFYPETFAMGKLTIFYNGWRTLDLFVEKFFSFAAFGYLFAAYRTNKSLPQRAANVWALTAMVAIAVESAKLTIAARSFQSENLVFALIGAALGVAIERRVSFAHLSSRRSLLFLTVLAIALLGYFQMEPFDWISRGELRWKLQQIEWFPFAAYYWSDPRAVLFDLLKKLYLAIPIGFLLIARTDKTVREWRLPVGAVVALLGIFFEASQIVIRSRTPAVTDVLMIAAGGWIGALAGHLYHSTTASNEPAS